MENSEKKNLNETENKAEAVENTSNEKEVKLEKKSDKPDTKEKKSDKKSGEVSEKNEKKAEKKAARKARNSLKARAFRRGWFSVVLVVLFIVAVVVLNLTASTLVDKIPALSVDVTGSDNFELTQDTLDYLPTLDENIKIIVLSDEKDFKDGGEYYLQANTLLHQYDNESDKITLEYVDMSTNPTFSNNYPDEKLSYYNVIVQGENDYKYVTESDMFDVQMDYNTYSYYIAGSKVEEAITSAILSVTLDEKPKATFISDINGEDYSAFKSYLESNGFETDEASPAMGIIPEDTEILVLFAPSADLDAGYVNTIADFLNNNGEYGKQLLYFPAASLTALPNIDSLLEEWGMAVEKGYAVENDTNYMAPFSTGYYVYAAQYSDTTYSSNMKNSSLPYCVISNYTRAVKILDDSVASPLLSLSEQSEIAYPVESGDEIVDADYQESPNLAVGAIATKGTTVTADSDSDTDTSATEDKSSNIVVIASSVSMSETMIKSSVYGNSTYALALLNTLTGRGNVGISIESTSLASEQLGITSSQIYTLGALFTFVVPIGVLIAGIVIFIRRRNM